MFRPAIVFLLSSSLLTILVMFVNQRGYHNSGKILMSFLNSFFMAVASFYFFGSISDFHIFLLLSALIPLFFWPLSNPAYLILFVLLNYGLYMIAEFLPPILEPVIELPFNYIEVFQSTNVLVCFLGAAIAIIFYTVLASKKEEDLVKRTIELEGSKRHQDLVYSVIAHDLRSPLKRVLGLTALLQKKHKNYDDDKAEEMIALVYKSSTSLDNLLENLLDWSKLKSGLYNINAEFLFLNLVIDDVINLLKDTALEKKLKIENNVDSNCKVYADADMLSTVIRNLVANAIKFTPFDGMINISSTKLDKMLQVCIEDTGVGIPQEHLQDLFSLSSTYTNIGTASEKGSGLGLKICYDFLTINGGEIWAESELGKGSRFYFTIPMADN